MSRETREVVATLPTGALPFRVAFTPDCGGVLVTCADAGEVMCFDAETKQLAWRLRTHDDDAPNNLPMGVAVDPDGAFAYVTCGRDQTIAVISLPRGAVVGRITARAGADGIAYARLTKEGEQAVVR